MSIALNNSKLRPVNHVSDRAVLPIEKDKSTSLINISNDSPLLKEKNELFLNSVHHFRAIAILFIVAGHCFGISGLEFNSPVEKVIANLLTGGTVLFVFISGFLFHHAFYKKYQYKNFVIGKIKTVLIPYVLLGALPVFFFVFRRDGGWDGYFLPNGNGLFSEYFVPILKYYWTGSFLTAYWYVPFIITTFILSPLHFWFVKSKPSFQFGITFFLCIASLLIHRPVDNLNTLQSFIYFTPIYLIGILCSVYKNRIYFSLSGKEHILLALIIALAYLQSTLGIVGNYHKDIFEYGGFDIMFVQKIIMCLLFMVFLQRFNTINIKLIHILAATSFAIFFLHPFMLWEIKRTFGKFIAFNSWVAFSFYVMIIVVVCICIAQISKRLLPRYSRFLIGY